MSKPFDPLDFIPSPEAIQKHLHEVERRANRLRILLRVSKEIHSNQTEELVAWPQKGRRADDR